MTVYLLISYNIDDPEMFRGYPPNVAKILPRYGARVLAADTDGKALEGTVRNMNVIIEFPSEEAVRACYNDPEYRAVMPLRLRSVSDCSMIIVKQFVQHPDGPSSGVRQIP
jgi:uncharacterized protein (DUF1330 family)